MSTRDPAQAHELRRGRWMFGYAVPWFPDLIGDPSAAISGRPVVEAFGRQIAFLRAIASGAPSGSTMQLRFISRPGEESLHCVLVGAAPTPESAAMLSAITLTAMPPEVPLQDLPRPALKETLDELRVDTITSDDVVEIRRAVEIADPTVLRGLAGQDLVVAPWTWSPQAMLSSLGLLRRQPSVTHLVVHIAPTTFPGEVASYLQDEVERIRHELADGEELPALVAVALNYRRWLRLLPKGCLAMRVVVASRSGLVPGLAESLSTDLTRAFESGDMVGEGAAEVVRPHGGGELDACASLLDDLEAVSWRAPRDPMLAELVHLFDPREANVAFRIPITPSGGLPGVATRRMSSLDEGVGLRGATGEAVRIASNHDGRPFALTTGDVNQHVLVGGQPGFGKTSTVQLLLRRLWIEQGIPFLVIDPAKDDYGQLLGDLAEHGDVEHIRLDPSTVCFNPLAPPPATPTAVHAGRVLAAFDSAWSLSSVNPLALVLLQRGLKRAYDHAVDGSPTLVDLYRSVADLIGRSAFAAEARANLEGSLLGRLEVLLTTTVGRSLSGGPDDGIDWDRLMARPTLVELGKLAGPAERALVFALLIGGLVGYRESHPQPGGLAHVTVLEEAHRVLRPSASNDAGAEVFIDAIAELRGAGEGFVVVDQSPGLLHPGVARLTGTKIVHRLVDLQERGAMAQSMVLDHRQSDELARLAPRRAVAYPASGDTAVLVDIDPLEFREPAVGAIRRPHASLSRDTSARETPFPCAGCPVACRGAAARPLVPALLAALDAAPPDPAVLDEHARTMVKTGAERFCLAASAAATVWQHDELEKDLALDLLRRMYLRRLQRATVTAQAAEAARAGAAAQAVPLSHPTDQT